MGAEALRRITESPLSEQQRYLLGECVEAYLPLDESQWDEFNRVLSRAPYEEVRKMRATTRELGIREGREEGIREGREEGIREGREEGLRESLRTLLEERFGPLTKRVARRVDSLPTDRIRAVFTQALRADSLRDLGLED